jgi:cell division protein FtsL
MIQITRNMLDNQKLSAYSQFKIFVCTLILIVPAIIAHLVAAILSLCFTLILVPTEMYNILYKIEKTNTILKEKKKNGTL